MRVLEHQLGLSKNTVQAAYDELVARGVLEAREREGVFVAAGPDAAAMRAPVAAPPLLRLLPELPVGGGRAPRGSIALSTVFIDPELLPRERLADCARSVLRSPGLAAFYDAQGYPPLRELIAARLRARGMDVSAANVIVTTGSQQALDLCARASAVRRVAIESPTYAHARLLFQSLGFAITGLPVDPFHIDKHGFRAPFVCGCRDLGEALRRIAEGAALVRTKGEAGTGDVVEAVRHLRAMRTEMRRLTTLEVEELGAEARRLGAPVELVAAVAKSGKLPVPQFAAGGIATPADAALCMALGAEAVFVGSGIFLGEAPPRRARAIVEAVAHWQDPRRLADVSAGLGAAMKGRSAAALDPSERLAARGA